MNVQRVLWDSLATGINSFVSKIKSQNPHGTDTVLSIVITY